MSETKKALKSYNKVFNQEFNLDFERFANCSQDAIYHYDTGAKRYLFHNRKFRFFFHVENEVENTALSLKIIQSIHPEDHEQFLNALNQSLLAGQKEGEAEYRVLFSDGSIRWLHDRWIVLRNEKGEPYACQGFIRDNTRQKLTELQFIESKQNALIGSYIVQKGKFKYVNPIFTSITGYTEEELIGTESLTIVHEDYRDHVCQCAVTMLKGEDLTPYEFSVLDKSGSTHWVMETVTSVIYHGERAVLGYVFPYC